METYYMVADYLYTLLIMVITAYCYCYFAKQFLKQKRHLWMMGETYFFVMMVLYHIPVIISNVVGYGIGIASGLAVMYLLDRRNLRQKIFLALTFFSLRWLSFAMANCLNSVVEQRMEQLPNFEFDLELQFRVFLVELCISFALSFLFLFTAVWVISKQYVYKKEEMTRKELLILLIPSISGVFEYGILKYYDLIYERDAGRNLYDIHGAYNWLCFLLYSVLLATIIVMTGLFQSLMGRREEEKRNEILQGQIRDMKQHISEVEKLYRDIRALKHDMGNHVMTLENLCLRNEYEEAQKYMQELRAQFAVTADEIRSGNPVTDVILAERAKEAKEQGIKFVCSFSYPVNTSLNSFDVGVVLHNAILNALEAAQETTEPFVQIRAYREKNAYMIEVMNTYSGKCLLDEESGLPVTTGKAEAGHGFGLANIQRVAEKYHGGIDIKQEEKYFILSVMLMTE